MSLLHKLDFMLLHNKANCYIKILKGITIN